MSDSSGFLRPLQTAPLTAKQERAVRAVCPGLGMTLRHDAPLDHPLWGPVRTVARGHAADPALRYRASSGGALSALLIHLLESGAVDFVLHTAADPDRPTGNRTVISRTAGDVASASGSRYAPSAPLAGLDRVLARAERAGERGAFVGKPCDVAALRALGRLDPRVGRVFPCALSFFCAGVPSLGAVDRLVARLGLAGAALAAFRFRGNGWPGRATATAEDGREASMSYADSWGQVLSRDVQFRCKICPDGVGSFADLAFGDAWQTDPRGYPLFDEAPGESLVVARTEKGEALLAEAVRNGAIVARPLPVGAIGPMQPGQKRRKSLLVARLAALATLGRPRPRYAGFRIARAALAARPADLGRNYVGMLLRALGQRA